MYTYRYVYIYIYIYAHTCCFRVEVLTNHPDQVKTMTQAGVPFLEALAKAPPIVASIYTYYNY